MRILFYTKTACTLCDEAESILDILKTEYSHSIEKRDIYTNDNWLEKYHLSIPVIEINGEQLNGDKINFDSVRTLLEKHKGD